jgi:hypothetical protein
MPVRRSSGPGNSCPASAAFVCPKSQKSESAKSGLYGEGVLEEWNFQRGSSQMLLSDGRDSCQGANLADENAVCGRLEMRRAAVVPEYD